MRDRQEKKEQKEERHNRTVTGNCGRIENVNFDISNEEEMKLT